MPTVTATTTTPQQLRDLLAQLRLAIDRCDQSTQDAVALCEKIAMAAGSPDLPDSAFSLIGLEAAGCRDVFPGGQSEFDLAVARDCLGLMEDLCELATRRSSKVTLRPRGQAEA